MTLQDWRPGPEADGEPFAEARPRRRVWLLAGVAVVVLALVAVVVVARQLATSSAGAATSRPGAASTSPARTEGPDLIVVDVHDPAAPDVVSARLRIGTGSLVTRHAPEKVPDFLTCTVDDGSLEYLPVEIRSPQLWSSGTVEVQTTARTPAGIGRLGFFFQAGDRATPCPNGSWPTTDSFQASNMGQTVITGYVVLDGAVTPSTPHGRPDVFGSLTLRVSNVRLSGRPGIVSTPIVGALCPGTRDAVCAQLS